jgi:hypothetical protein
MASAHLEEGVLRRDVTFIDDLVPMDELERRLQARNRLGREGRMMLVEKAGR